jgi:hypothetical protein
MSIGNRPAIQVVLSETLVRKIAIDFRKTCGFLCSEDLVTDRLVIAAIIALVQFVVSVGQVSTSRVFGL